MEFHARQPETCEKCKGIINTGEQITWNRTTGAKYHPACSEKTALETIEAGPEKAKPQTKVKSKDILAKLMSELSSSIQEEEIRRIVRDEVQEAKIIEVRTPDNVQVISGTHEKFEHLLYLVGLRHHTYMYGPPGSGKSTAARQCADALGWQYGYISLNPQTPDSRLLGYMDANGVYRPTLFRKLYQDGGVFCIDELDNASASLLTTLNSALENGHGAFPDGLIERHANFVLVATGNTAGYGANPAFPDRRPFDAAFAERFTYIEWGYDTKMEKRLALEFNPEAGDWVQWVWKLRKWAGANFPRLIVSPRATFKLAIYSKTTPFTQEEMVDNVVFRGIQKDVRDKALLANPLPTRQ